MSLDCLCPFLHWNNLHLFQNWLACGWGQSEVTFGHSRNWVPSQEVALREGKFWQSICLLLSDSASCEPQRRSAHVRVFALLHQRWHNQVHCSAAAHDPLPLGSSWPPSTSLPCWDKSSRVTYLAARRALNYPCPWLHARHLITGFEIKDFLPSVCWEGGYHRGFRTLCLLGRKGNEWLPSS